jgi:hypothetical protein
MDEGLYVYDAVPAYAYRETEGKNAGMMFETKCPHTFVAQTNGEAVQKAIAHAKERYEQYFKDAYKDCFLSSIKVWLKYIGPIKDNGEGTSRNVGVIFEWKHDYPDTIESYTEAYLKDYTGLTAGPKTVKVKRVDATPSCGKEGDAQTEGCVHFDLCKLDNCNGEHFMEEPQWMD